jgi:tetratricopeptide (TPR) repeat protein
VRLVSEQTISPEAYKWLIRGRALYDWANQENLYQVINYFEKAVEADPGYALAWGQLASARLVSMAWQPFDKAGSATISAYERALALDPKQSQALTTKALITQLIQRDWDAAGKLHQQAIASGDNSAAMVAYAVLYLQHIDRFADAIQLNADAEKRDPLHASYKSNLAGILLLSGDADAAVRKAREALELNPQHEFALANLIAAYTETGDFTAVQRLLDSIPPELQGLPMIRALVGRYYAARGDEEKARQIYRELRKLLDSLTPVGIMYTAELALSLGEVEESINLQERLAEGGSWMQFWSRPLFRHNDAIKNHPRYQALLKRMGLDDASVTALYTRMSFD